MVLGIDSVWLKMVQLMSELESSHHAVSFSPLVAAVVSVKKTQGCASDPETVTFYCLDH